MAVDYAETPHVSHVSHPPSGERVRLRAAVLSLGGLLGWQPREVIAFAEAVTDRPWRRCGCADFEAVLEEYRSMVRAVQEKAERRTAREEQARLERNEVQGSANPY